MDCIYNQNKILFDYFSFTVKCEDENIEPEDIITLLGLDSVIFIDTFGTKGYQHRYYYDGVSIMFGGRDHIWCEMSGQGCRVYESYGNNAWFDLLYWVYDNDNAHFTRIDLAYDDFNGMLDMSKIESDVFAGNWISKATKIHPDYTITREGVTGVTFTVGERASNISVRIYDKAAERNKSDEIPHWIRCEIQLRHKHADNLAMYLLCKDLDTVLGVKIPNNEVRINYVYFAVLNNFFRFIDKSVNDDSNMWRKPMVDHWKRFAESITNAKLSLYSAPGVEYNEIKLRHTVEEQYGGMIYTYLQLFGSEVLADETAKRRPYLNKKYIELLEKRRQYERKSDFDEFVDLKGIC